MGKEIKKITVAAAMVKCLEAEGISTVFGYPGAAICPFYDKLTNSGIEHILVRQEANGGHAASGYARITGKPAVCIATSGPGATNLITAIATAYMDSIPLICITGQVNSSDIGKDVFQEADITGAAEPFVKHSYLVSDKDDISDIFKKAFYIAGTGRPGPVLIDVPMDIQMEEIEFSYPESVEIRSYKPNIKGNKLQIKRIIEAIKVSEKPLILTGGGAFASSAQLRIKDFAERLNIPVVNTMMGISTLPESHPLHFGMIGMHGKKSANMAINECDLLLLFGARVGDRAVSAFGDRENLKVVHVDIDPAEIGKNLHTDIPVVGDLNTILGQLIELLPSGELCHDKWIKELSKYKQIGDVDISNYTSPSGTVNPKAFIELLSRKIPEKTVISADVGQNQIWTANNIRLDGGRFITSGGMGTMGYSVPAAIGAKKADSENLVIAICGDGSFQMQFMELATMIQHNIDVKIIVMVNNRLGMVRELQTNKYGNHQTAVFLDGSPDFIKIAEAYGIAGESVDSLDEVNGALDRLINSKTPYILEVKVDKDEKSVIL